MIVDKGTNNADYPAAGGIKDPSTRSGYRRRRQGTTDTNKRRGSEKKVKDPGQDG